MAYSRLKLPTLRYFIGNSPNRSRERAYTEITDGYVGNTLLIRIATPTQNRQGCEILAKARIRECGRETDKVVATRHACRAGALRRRAERSGYPKPHVMDGAQRRGYRKNAGGTPATTAEDRTDKAVRLTRDH